MAAGGGRPRCGVDICCTGLEDGRGKRDLLVEAIGGSDNPVEATAGEKREVEGGVGGV